MPYPPRVCFDGALYHVTIRGDNRERIFIDDEDCRRYLLLLRRYKDRLCFKLHAYALMPNHVHLIVEPGSEATISRIMQHLSVAYAKYFNRRHRRVGHVFQERFHSRLIDKDTYLLVASRYVHLNPVRAALARHPLEFPWSSYAAYATSARKSSQLVDTEDVLALVAQHAEHQRTAYRDFVETKWQTEAAALPELDL